MKNLSDRRLDLCKTFSQNCFKSEKYNTWFAKKNDQSINTRSKKNTLKQVTTRTVRYEKSPLPYLTALLNK